MVHIPARGRQKWDTKSEECIFVGGGSHLTESRLADRSYGRQSFGRQVWPTGRMADRSFGRQVVWPTGRMADRSFGRQVVWLTGCMADRWFGRLVVWPTGRLVDWSFGRLVVWSTGRLADWSFGRLVVRPTERATKCIQLLSLSSDTVTQVCNDGLVIYRCMCVKRVEIAPLW
ncbi:hypothetical protein M513_12313 [Trichuris suis]|uniref:Uncharacterized protein n=1 Tax=Trichuris suis TaxID=68888 RepID=A0A085LP89_9BILA|nr:hypothetical protein M513_12313 [Trichuris suis]